MKSLSLFTLAMLLLLVVSSFTRAADAPSAIQSQTLNAMGLGGMKPISDDAGRQVRGKGTFAGVWGHSSASFHGQISSNNYEAGANWIHKPAFAEGGSLSFTGKFNAQFAADPISHALSLQVTGGFAGGRAFAFAR